MNPYEYLTKKCDLTDNHKNDLLNRGFTEKTIKEFRFFSGGKQLLEIEPALLKAFSKEELLSSGVFLTKDDKLHISNSLLGDRIVIPSLNKEGIAYFLKPHKLGLKGQATHIYCEKAIGREIILTEGEFKAVAAYQLGFKSLAVPGISAFAVKNFNKLTKILNDNKVKEICIIFDNEVKNDPKVGKFVQDPMMRYETQFWSYFLCDKLERENFICRIGTLPDSWRVNGKVDIDSAVADGKTYEDIKQVWNRALDAKEYIKSQQGECAEILKKKIAKRWLKSTVRKDWGKYVVDRVRGSKGQVVTETISNFTLKIIATHETPEGIIREIVFVDEFGKSSQPFHLEASSMTGADAFATFCMDKGPYIWRGNKTDLCNIWEGEFLEDDGRRIVEPDHIGWLPQENMWLFGNVAFRNNEELRPDDNHIFWTKSKGIKPVPISVTTGRSVISEGIPYLSLSADVSMKDLYSKLSDTFSTKSVNDVKDENGKYKAALCLGWLAATVFMEDVFKMFGSFPFLFVTGRKGSGKSTIAEWLMNYFGLENSGKMAMDTTATAMQRYLSYYSSLPLFIDEYRNVKDITKKNGFFRNAYNRQSAGKGIKSNFGIREGKIRGTILFSGEDTPEDNALLSRCVVVRAPRERETNHFNWFMTNRTKFSYHLLDLLRNREEKKDIFLKVLAKAKKFFAENGCDDRTAINYAVISAGFAVVIGENELDAKTFARWLKDETVRVKDEYESEHAIMTFLDDLTSSQAMNQVPKEFIGAKDGKISLYFHGLYNIWAKDYRSRNSLEPFKNTAMRDYLKEEDGYITTMNTRNGDKVFRCLVFDAEKCPQQLRDLAGLNEEDYVKM